MSKETKTAPAADRKAVITKNPDSVVFAEAPFYNLANIRKGALSLIVRASSDPKKVKAIKETLTVLLKFLEVRAKHAEKVRAADIKAAEARDADRAVAAAQAREADARALVRDAEANKTRGEAQLKALGAEGYTEDK